MGLLVTATWIPQHCWNSSPAGKAVLNFSDLPHPFKLMQLLMFSSLKRFAVFDFDPNKPSATVITSANELVSQADFIHM